MTEGEVLHNDHRNKIDIQRNKCQSSLFHNCNFHNHLLADLKLDHILYIRNYYLPKLLEKKQLTAPEQLSLRK